MKLNKKTKVQEIQNPFRPLTGLPRKHSSCRITLGSLIPYDEEAEYSLQLDADPVEEFVGDIKSTIPKTDFYIDKVYDLWFFKENHYKALLKLARKYFDEVLTEDKDGNKHKYKKTP